MCKRHFAYLECPRCHILTSGIDVVERCEAVGVPIYGCKEKPSDLVFYPHTRQHYRQTAFHAWHYRPDQPLGLVTQDLAYCDATSACPDCIVAETDPGAREVLSVSRDVNWPHALPQERDWRIFDKSTLDERLGPPREIGLVELWRRWCHCRVRGFRKRRNEKRRAAAAAAGTRFLMLGRRI